MKRMMKIVAALLIVSTIVLSVPAHPVAISTFRESRRYSRKTRARALPWNMYPANRRRIFWKVAHKQKEQDATCSSTSMLLGKSLKRRL